MNDIKDFILFGKYKVHEYEYFFIYNNEEIKADSCFSNMYNKSWCNVNDIRYDNVSYYSKQTSIVYKKLPDCTLISIHFTLALILFYVLYKIITYFFWGEIIK